MNKHHHYQTNDKDVQIIHFSNGSWNPDYTVRVTTKDNIATIEMCYMGQPVTRQHIDLRVPGDPDAIAALQDLHYGQADETSPNHDRLRDSERDITS